MSRNPTTKVAKQSSVLLGVQALLMLMQLSYTAVTARVFSPDTFGAFAVASAITSIGSLLAVNGLAKAAARRPEESPSEDRELLGAALLVSTLLAALLFTSAPWLSRLWSDADATSLTRLLSLSIIPSAYTGVQFGILRRRGRLGELTSITFVAGLLAILVGVASVLVTRNQLSLAVMPIASPLLQAGLAAHRLRGSAWPSQPTVRVRADVRYGLLSSGTSVATYFIFTTPMWVLSRVVGPAALGSWNRALAITQVPVETATRAWSTVAFPYFRKAPELSSDRQRWTDMFCTIAWFALPIAAGLAPAVYVLVPVVLGPQWELAAEMAVWLWLAAWFGTVNSVIATAVEAAGKFGVLWTVLTANAVVMVVASFGIWRTGQWQWLGLGFLLCSATGIVANLIASHVAGLTDGRTATAWTLGSAGVATLAVSMPMLVAAIQGLGFWSTVTSVTTVVGFLSLTVINKARLPFLDRLLDS